MRGGDDVKEGGRQLIASYRLNLWPRRHPAELADNIYTCTGRYIYIQHVVRETFSFSVCFCFDQDSTQSTTG